MTKSAKKTALQKRREKPEATMLWVCEITEDGVRHIFREVRDGRYGKFLTAFAKAYLAADRKNRQLLYSVALAIIGKYGLNSMVPQEFSEEEKS